MIEDPGFRIRSVAARFARHKRLTIAGALLLALALLLAFWDWNWFRPLVAGRPAALGVVYPPAALLPTIERGRGKDHNCGALIEAGANGTPDKAQIR